MQKIEVISQVAKKLKDMPIFVLPFGEQFEIVRDLSTLFSEMERELLESGSSDTETFVKIKEINGQLSLTPLNEYRVFSSLKDLMFTFRAQNELNQSEKNLLELVDKVLVRAKDFWISEMSLSELDLSSEEIENQTKSLLEKEMELYSLDYFLFMNKAVGESGDKASVILTGADTMPGLRSDAMQDDMLTKIVYNIKDKETRYQMISDYYRYKAAFLPIGEKEKLTIEEVSIIESALRLYCLSLLEILQENGINEIVNGLSFPYGSGVMIADVRKQLEAK